MAKREFPKVEWTCPRCGKTVMIKSGTRRKVCGDCKKDYNKEIRKSREQRLREYYQGKAPRPLDAPKATIVEVVAYQKAHDIKSYGLAVHVMEQRGLA